MIVSQRLGAVTVQSKGYRGSYFVLPREGVGRLITLWFDEYSFERGGVARKNQDFAIGLSAKQLHALIAEP